MEHESEGQAVHLAVGHPYAALCLFEAQTVISWTSWLVGGKPVQGSLCPGKRSFQEVP